MLFAGVSENTFLVLEHLFWWISIGSILLFLPYFAYSKHAHLFMAPLNYLTKPERPGMGTPDALDFEDESVEQFGAERIEQLSRTALMDAYACIMCNRCQDVCPAYITGKELSPSALEVNKRAILREEGTAVAGGAASSHPLLGWAINEEAGATSSTLPFERGRAINVPLRSEFILLAEDPGGLTGSWRSVAGAF